MEKLAIEAGCWSRPRCSKDTCSEILPGFGAGIQSKHSRIYGTRIDGGGGTRPCRRVEDS